MLTGEIYTENPLPPLSISEQGVMKSLGGRDEVEVAVSGVVELLAGRLSLWSK
ncbi:hypothetical protein LguiA_022277 [Lonicera macranthoides]